MTTAFQLSPDVCELIFRVRSRIAQNCLIVDQSMKLVQSSRALVEARSTDLRMDRYHIEISSAKIRHTHQLLKGVQGF